MAFKYLLIDQRGEAGLITLNRAPVNALNSELMAELAKALDQFEAKDDVGAIVITGSEKAFAAGADIAEMRDKSFIDAYHGDFIGKWERVTRCRKPVIAAVAGYALGGGCELAMMCDFILAGDNAKFGQPEITIGIMPGAGGSQRLTRFVGKSKAMEMCLTGRQMDAAEAERSGLVSRVVPTAQLVDEAIKAAQKIASFSATAVMLTKEGVNRAYETTLAEGVHFERRMFYALFATADQKEGMAAFLEKREPQFTNR